MMTPSDIDRIRNNCLSQAQFLRDEAREIERWPFMAPVATLWRSWAAAWTAAAERMERDKQ